MINIYAHSFVHIGFFSCSPLTIDRSCCLSSPIFLLLNPKIYHLGHGYRILVVLLPNILFYSLLTNYHSLLTAHCSLLTRYHSPSPASKLFHIWEQKIVLRKDHSIQLLLKIVYGLLVHQVRKKNDLMHFWLE
jgi:hypothetical protein